MNESLQHTLGHMHCLHKVVDNVDVKNIFWPAKSVNQAQECNTHFSSPTSNQILLTPSAYCALTTNYKTCQISILISAKRTSDGMCIIPTVLVRILPLRLIVRVRIKYRNMDEHLHLSFCMDRIALVLPVKTWSLSPLNQHVDKHMLVTLYWLHFLRTYRPT